MFKSYNNFYAANRCGARRSRAGPCAKLSPAAPGGVDTRRDGVHVHAARPVRTVHTLIDLVLADLQDMVMQSGIARASDVLEQSESLAGILPCTHAAIFLNDMHGEEHTDEIGMHTVLYSLLRAPRRDARQPCPALPAHQRLLPRDVTWRRCAYSRNLRHKRESGCRGNRVAPARCGATDVRGSASSARGLPTARAAGGRGSDERRAARPSYGSHPIAVNNYRARRILRTR